jgi:small subunit ribosomal protein S20
MSKPTPIGSHGCQAVVRFFLFRFPKEIPEFMANIASAQKRIRQTVVRTARNKARRSRVHSFVRKLEEAIAGGDHAQARAAFIAAQPEMQRAVTKGVLKANTVSRRISRLSARVKALAA